MEQDCDSMNFISHYWFFLGIQMHQHRSSRILKQWGSDFIVIFFCCVYISNCQRDFDYRDEYLLRSGGNVRPEYSEDPRGKNIGNFRKKWTLSCIILSIVFISILLHLYLYLFFLEPIQPTRRPNIRTCRPDEATCYDGTCISKVIYLYL